MKTFGTSAPLKDRQRQFGFEADRVAAAAKELMGRRLGVRASGGLLNDRSARSLVPGDHEAVFLPAQGLPVALIASGARRSGKNLP